MYMFLTHTNVSENDNDKEDDNEKAIITEKMTIMTMKNTKVKNHICVFYIHDIYTNNILLYFFAHNKTNPFLCMCF